MVARALCFGCFPALAYGSCRDSDQGTTLRASDLHNARATILNPFNLLDFLDKFLSQQQPISSSSAANEVQSCIQEACMAQSPGPLTFWRDNTIHPTLKQLAGRFLAIPASSAQWRDCLVLLVMSIGSTVLLKDQTFERLIFFCCNRHLP